MTEPLLTQNLLLVHARGGVEAYAGERYLGTWERAERVHAGAVLLQSPDWELRVRCQHLTERSQHDLMP